jgi:hypothetical protein
VRFSAVPLHPGIDKASFIESEFKKIGLETFNRAKRLASIFFMTESKRTTLNVQIDGTAINADGYVLSPTNQLHFLRRWRK